VRLEAEIEHSGHGAVDVGRRGGKARGVRILCLDVVSASEWGTITRLLGRVDKVPVSKRCAFGVEYFSLLRGLHLYLASDGDPRPEQHSVADSADADPLWLAGHGFLSFMFHSGRFDDEFTLP